MTTTTFKISFNASKASETASKILEEVARKKEEHHNEMVQIAINQIVAKIKEAANNGEFKIRITYNEIPEEAKAISDQVASAMMKTIAKENTPVPDIECSLDVLGDAVKVLKEEAGFIIRRVVPNVDGRFPYLDVAWNKPADNADDEMK